MCCNVCMRYWKRFLYLANINLVYCQLQHTIFFLKFVLVDFLFFFFFFILKEINTFYKDSSMLKWSSSTQQCVPVDDEPRVW